MADIWFLRDPTFTSTSRFLEEQYQLVAVGGGSGSRSKQRVVNINPHGSSGGISENAGGGDSASFLELLKHIRHLDTRLDAMQTKLDMVRT